MLQSLFLCHFLATDEHGFSQTVYLTKLLFNYVIDQLFNFDPCSSV